MSGNRRACTYRSGFFFDPADVIGLWDQVDIRVKISLSHFVPAYVYSDLSRFLRDPIDRVSDRLGQGVKHHHIHHSSRGPGFNPQ
jgi:hypothetical protein